jgi:hypothetical protein
MTITVAVLAGLTIGLTIGAVVAGLVLMEHPRRWMVCVLLPGELQVALAKLRRIICAASKRKSSIVWKRACKRAPAI